MYCPIMFMSGVPCMKLCTAKNHARGEILIFMHGNIIFMHEKIIFLHGNMRFPCKTFS